MLNNYQKFFISTFAIFAVLFLVLPVLTLAADASVSCDQQYPWCKGETSDIAGLVSKFYNYALAAVGVAALGAIIFGGIKYTVSAGNPSGQADAISWITGAVWGLVLLLGANLLLRTIGGTKLVDLKMDKLVPVEVKKEESGTTGFKTGNLILYDGNLVRSQLSEASKGGITFNKNECVSDCKANCSCTSMNNLPKIAQDGLLETQKRFGPIQVTGGTENYIVSKTGDYVHQTHGPGQANVDISFNNTLNGTLAELTPTGTTPKGEPIYNITLDNGQKAVFVKESDHWHVSY